MNFIKKFPLSRQLNTGLPDGKRHYMEVSAKRWCEYLERKPLVAVYTEGRRDGPEDPSLIGLESLGYHYPISEAETDRILLMAQYGHQCLHSCYACVEQHKVDPSHRCIRGVKNCTWCESTGMACNQEGQVPNFPDDWMFRCYAQRIKVAQWSGSWPIKTVFDARQLRSEFAEHMPFPEDFYQAMEEKEEEGNEELEQDSLFDGVEYEKEDRSAMSPYGVDSVKSR